MIDINLVNRKLVKPCSPTPENLKNYKLSFMDEFVVPMEMEVGVLLFYASKEKQIQIIKLEESLSRVLLQFYPLAGRYVMKDRLVDCSDQGAEFIEAEAPNVELVRLVGERNLENLSGFFPRKNHQVDEATYPLLSVQITEVKCGGGLVIGISVSHKIFDASSLDTFIAAWSTSNATKGESSMGIICPILDSSSLFPLKNWNGYYSDTEFICRIADTTRVCIKRFTFDNEAIARLRSKLRPREGNRRWSRVRVASAFVAKALIGVERARARHAGKLRPCIIVQTANIRERTTPPLPEHSCGNLVLPSYLRCKTEEMGIQELVDLMSDDVDKCIANCSEILSLGEDGLKRLVAEPTAETFEAWRRGEANFMFFTDWSKCGFNEADFGWGKPVCASIIPTPGENGAVLMGSKNRDGIEAWVQLDKKGMALFEQDDEMRLLAT